MLQSIYSCFCRNTRRYVNEPTTKTPLLFDSDKKQGGATGNTVIGQPQTVSVTDGLYPVDNQIDKKAAKAGGRPRKITVGFTNVKSVDKRLQDQAKLYNDYYEKFDDLQCFYNELCEAFGQDNPAKTLDSTFQIIRQKTRVYGDDISLTVSRKPQHGYTRIEFDAKQVPNDVLVHLNRFNSANKTIKELAERGPKVIDAIQLVLKDETELRRDVLAASMGAEGPDAMKMCLGGINELRRVPGYVEEILRRTKKIHKKGQRAATLLTQEDEDIPQMNDVLINLEVSTSSGTEDNKSVRAKKTKPAKTRSDLNATAVVRTASMTHGEDDEEEEVDTTSLPEVKDNKNSNDQSNAQNDTTTEPTTEANDNVKNES